MSFNPMQVVMANNFNLTWNNYRVSMETNLRDLRESGEHSDLKIYCGEKVFLAHRVVVAMGCGVLGGLVGEVNCCCEIGIILPDVDFEQMEKILDFLYFGEVTVNESALGEFFEVARLLGVRGLVEQCHEKSIFVKALNSEKIIEDFSSSSSTSSLNEKPNQNSRLRATDPRPCPKCGKIYRSAHTLRTHLEDKHTSCPGYRCVLCGTVAKSRNSLHSHMSRQHRGISTKDLPIQKMPTPFDPILASRLLGETDGSSAILDTYLAFIRENSSK